MSTQLAQIIRDIKASPDAKLIARDLQIVSNMINVAKEIPESYRSRLINALVAYDATISALFSNKYISDETLNKFLKDYTEVDMESVVGDIIFRFKSPYIWLLILTRLYSFLVKAAYPSEYITVAESEQDIISELMQYDNEARNKRASEIIPGLVELINAVFVYLMEQGKLQADAVKKLSDKITLVSNKLEIQVPALAEVQKQF